MATAATSSSLESEFPYSLYVPTCLSSIRYSYYPPWINQSIIDRERTNIGMNRTISLPLPTHRLASSALRALQVDAELSPFVRRSFALTTPTSPSATAQPGEEKEVDDEEKKTVLQTTYHATTNRMLRVAVNGFMESLGVVLGVMGELDVDVLREELGK